MTKCSRTKKVFIKALFIILIASLTIPVLAAGTRTVSVSTDDVKMIVDGQTVTTKDGNGNNLRPLVIDGVVYLPAQSVSHAFNATLSWNSSAKEVKLTSKPLTSAPATTSEPAAPSAAANSGYIGLDKAKQIALQHAGVNASDATFIKAKLDYDDSQPEYEIEFYVKNTEYDYDINAATGAIKSWDHDVENYSISAQGSADAASSIISLADAKALARAKAPGAALYSCKLDFDDGIQVYEGELRDGNKEYEFKIDAKTGKFIKWKIDYDD